MRPSAALLFGVLSIILGASAWLDHSQFLPVVGRDSVAYYFGAAPPSVLLTDIALAAAALLALHFAVKRWLAPTLETARYLAPLALIGVNLLSFGVLRDDWRDLWAPIAYIAMDLRWTISLVAIALSVWVLRRDARSAPFRLAQGVDARRAFAGDLAIAGFVMAFVVISTPQIRFTSFATGDEPKYVRYLENWWQGNGMQIDTFKNISHLPRDHQSKLLHNFTYVWPALKENAATLADDLASLSSVANWTKRWNRAEEANNHIIKGKNGWHYQIHSPGLSVLLLPGYIIDRTFFDRRTSAFADDLFASQLVMLIVFAALALAAVRMTTAACADRTIAALTVCALMTALPIAAFPFTFYPETTAGLITGLVTWRLFTRTPISHGLAIASGLALAYLGWLHVRFLVVSVVAIVWLLWFYRGSPRVMATMLAVFSIGMLTLCAYAYHVTGSFMPSAPFALGVGSGYVNNRVPIGLVGLFVDRIYGLLPLAPIYLLAIPGVGLMAARRPRDLAMIATLGLALIVPAAGQGYWTDGSVPWRHALAILPLSAIPISLWLKERGTNPSTVAISLLLAALSIRTAVAYNLQNDKTITTMLDAGFSGWDLSVLFPITHRVRINPISPDAWQLFAIGAAAIAAFAYGALSPPPPPRVRGGLAYAGAFAISVALMAVLSSAAIVMGVEAHRWELLRAYRPPPPEPLPSYWFEVGMRPKAPWE